MVWEGRSKDSYQGLRCGREGGEGRGGRGRGERKENGKEEEGEKEKGEEEEREEEEEEWELMFAIWVCNEALLVLLR